MLIQKGDNPVFKEVEFDDSDWNVTSLPSEWNKIYPDYNGICWYRLHIYLPETLPVQSIGIRLGTICDADEAYLNGSLIGRSGVIGSKPDSAYDKIRIYEFPFTTLRPGSDNVLALRIRGAFAYANGPYMGTIKIDKYANLLAEYYRREVIDLIFVVIYTVFGIYFLFFFMLSRENKANLLFAILTLCISCYFFFRTQQKYLLEFSFYWAKKTEYLVLTWLVFLIMEFLMLYFKQKHRWFHFIFMGLTTLFFFIILFSSSYSCWDNMFQYLIIPSWLIGVITCIYIVISRLKREKDARLMFVALIILLFTMINDILVNMVAYKFIRLANYGFLFFLGSIAVILSHHFINLHKEVEDLNKNLEKKVMTRTNELNRTVFQLASAKEETDNILSNVQEGIFLIDQEYRIGSNYSRIMETIFKRGDLGGITLPELLKNIIASNILRQVEDFLEIIFTRKIPAKRLAQLNPLEEVKMTFNQEKGKTEKFLNFAFTRITGELENVFVLATVRDITERKNLALKIKKAEELAEKESRMFMEIILLNPQLLKNFLKESQLEIHSMEELLKKAQFSSNIKELLKNIYTAVHTIKGNAGMLEIKSLSEVTHEFENSIKDLYGKEEIKAVELSDLSHGLAEIKNILARVEAIIEKITQFRSSYGGGMLSDQEYIAESIRNMGSRVAHREHKSIRIELKSFRLPADSGLNIIALKRILLQLVKNAVVHGIEKQAEREKKGKPATGRIIVKSEPGYKILTIKITDDGGTLDPERIRQAVLKSGGYSSAELAEMQNENLALLIFKTGISTKEDLTIDAGRGIGLDIVKESLKELDGKISLVYVTGKYTQFRLTLPLTSPRPEGILT